ncbi:MAG: hypothetical protein SP4CHLAM5_08250 [Chlamydiia bacterium]|nr:hypothetical protein [Chlamydiia bacterium]MCH9618688.1 hypothetical protein [Chlamydiia bacterium]MCH9624409.1 hypothetical protein [Chlamydiia bacterium]
MIIRAFTFFLFIFFCDLHAKDIYLDIEADLPNKSSVSIFYHNKINNFSAKDLESGITRKNVFDVVFFSNVKEAVEIILYSKDAQAEVFSFTEEKTESHLPFHLFCMHDKNQIENGQVIYAQENIIEPISKVISVGMRVPRIKGVDIAGGLLSTHFTVILKHTG